MASVPSHASAATAAAVTDQELIAAPGAGKDLVVYSVVVSSDVGQTVDLEAAGTTLKWRMFAAANSTHGQSSEQPLFRCDANESLTLTTSGAGNTFVAVTYRIEAAHTG